MWNTYSNFFQVTTIACLACLCTSGTVKIGLFMLPLVGRIRFMMFVNLISIFVTCLLLFLDISHIVYLFPFNWGKVVSNKYINLIYTRQIKNKSKSSQYLGIAYNSSFVNLQYFFTSLLSYQLCYSCIYTEEESLIELTCENTLKENLTMWN